MEDVHEKAVDILDKTYKNVNDWLKFAEAKNGITATLNLAVLSALSSSEPLYGCRILFFLIMLCICVSTTVCLISFLPHANEDTKKQTGRNINLLYYMDIAAYKHKEYLKEVYLRCYGKEINYSDIPKLNIYYADEICVNAKIAVRKYRLSNLALQIDIAGIILTVVTFAYDCFSA